MRILLLIFSLCCSSILAAADPVLPDWFKTSFLDLSEDLEQAKQNNRHIMLYFHQNGCPYCAKLVRDNFHDKALVAKLQKNFDAIEINMFGNRDLTDWNGKDFSEKQFAEYLRVQFTPTLIFLSKKGQVVLRLNGYQSVDKMHIALDYVDRKAYLQKSFAHYLGDLKINKAGKLNDSNIFEPHPHLLMRNQTRAAQKYLAVFFEQPNCIECDYFHHNLLPLKYTQNALKQMQVVRFNALSDEKLITPAGEKTTAKNWYDSLKLTYAPAVVFFDKTGTEIIRKDAYFKQFHWHSMLDYVLSGAYKTQPNFQRFIINRGDEMRKQGISVDIWK
ncbi:MAG: thioredoxin fold domain-containing protein [Candidatus Thioglobus sp.]|nr:MAG: thioredoxin fold domain-containing protein [Candidatus Thioglobus sp.]